MAAEASQEVIVQTSEAGQETLNQVIFPIVDETFNFNSFNLLDWSKYVEMVLESRGLDDHFTHEVDPSNSRYKAWKREDANVCQWLLSSMAGDRFRKYLYLKTPKKIWDHQQKSNMRKSHTWRIFELVTKATTLVQGEMSVAEYAEELKTLWLAIDHFRPIKNPEEWQSTLQDRMFRFLMGMNKEYESLWSQILNHERVPNLEEAIHIVLDEESRIKLIPDSDKD
ncbi:uncharacterized protein LOC144700472 [Wolffia australiana]